jgi:hypothetical protein
MKHILNNLTEEEKNKIREQHTGGMKVMTENFSKLVNSKLGDSKPLVSEQNRKLVRRRFIKITNTKGVTMLFDVTEVETTSQGCKFYGDFRGEYDSVLSFLGFEERLFSGKVAGKKFSFDYSCSDPGTIMLKNAYGMNYDSTGKFIGKTENFTIDTAAQQVLSNVCRCSRYK